MTPEEFRKQGHAIVDWIADYRRDVAKYPVMARTAPGDIRPSLPDRPPEHAEPFAEIMRDFDRVIVPGISHWQHPSFFGYFPANSVLSSVLGDFLSTGLGVIGLSWQSSPALTELEEVVCDWMRQMLGLSDAWSGVINDTASTSTLVALLCARERASKFALDRGGTAGRGAPARRLRLGARAQLGGQGRAAGGVRTRQRPPRSVRRAERHARRRTRAAHRGRRARREDPVRHRRDDGNDDGDGVRPHRRDRRRREAVRRVAARRRRDGRLGDDPARMPLDVGRRRGRRLARDEPAQMARRRDRLLALLRARSRAPRPRDVDQSELPAVVGRRLGEELPRLGTAARPPVPRAQALVPHPGAGHHRPPGAHPARPGERPLVRVAGARRAGVARARARSRCRPSACGTIRRGSRATPLDAHTQRWAERLNRSGAAYLTPAILDGRWMVRVSIGGEQTEREHVAGALGSACASVVATD